MRHLPLRAEPPAATPHRRVPPHHFSTPRPSASQGPTYSKAVPHPTVMVSVLKRALPWSAGVRSMPQHAEPLVIPAIAGDEVLPSSHRDLRPYRSLLPPPRLCC